VRFFFWGQPCGTFECKFDNNKNCDDLRLISAGKPAGGGRIVANRGSYSEMREQRKVGRQGAGTPIFNTLDQRTPHAVRHPSPAHALEGPV
jgi:hypothetical protein